MLLLSQALLIGSGIVQWAVGSWTSGVVVFLSAEDHALQRSHCSKATACPTYILFLFPTGVLTAGEHNFPFQFLLPGMMQISG